MNRIIAGLIIGLVSVLQAGAESREELEAQIREHEAALGSLQSKLDSILRADAEKEATARQGKMEKFLNSVFPVDSLSLGEAEISLRCCKEQYGVYVAERHIGDVYSDGSRFTKYELADSVCIVLKAARLISPGFTFVTPSISPEADSLLRLWGGGVRGAEIDYGGSDVLVMDANCKSVSITSSDAGLVTIDIANHDGSRTIAVVTRGEVIGMKEIPQP